MQLLQLAGPSCRPMACLPRPAVGLQPIASSGCSSLAVRRCGLLPLPQQQRLGPQQQQQQRAALPRPAVRSSSLQCAASAAAFAAASFDGAGSSGGGASSPSYVHHPGGIAAVFAAIRAVLFYCTTLIFALPLFPCMLAVYPFVLQFDKYRRRAEHAINTLWAKLTTMFYYPVQIEGLENLPAANQPAVYVANHQSFLVRSWLCFVISAGCC
jgi:1-acyl-sn-glycerol-3-phosphate acyltransferase